jgi:uncharacterized protein YcfJ
MKVTVRTCLGIAVAALATHAAAQATFYAGEGFRGRSFTTDRQVGNFQRFGFNDRASSVIIDRGRWEVCEDARFSGRCVVLRRGQYPSLAAMGLNNQVSSVRPVGRGGRQLTETSPPVVAQPYGFYRRHGEPLYNADVTSVRAVVSQGPQQRCWVEREQIGDTNVPAAIAGAIIGGVLGHQIGGGSGRDVATALGAVGGAVAGANVSGGGFTRDVQRCTHVQGPAQPDYWDVTYVFRGREHRVQMTSPPGRTITVNRNGEPRM